MSCMSSNFFLSKNIPFASTNNNNETKAARKTNRKQKQYENSYNINIYE